jgi:superfamily I DNA and/or RNA helicase
VLRQRAMLLRDWRAQLDEPGEHLAAELIRYADVIGATCVDLSAQRDRLAGLAFDVVIVDEAAQIPLASMLVPLARARRAILVGDHRQLPPFVDNEVDEWLARRQSTEDGPSTEALRDLLATSAFERMMRGAPAGSHVLLGCQRRMPTVVADFVSTSFYNGQLRSAVPEVATSAPFRRPFAVIDTSDLPAAERAERERDGTETWQTRGYDNPAEARVVLDLVRWYARQGRRWAVVAPYRAQVQLLRLRLAEVLGHDAVADNVGTVDDFQGRERDVVLYSCTRSNRSGDVGFLSELRRLNVAITRAREQLVVVGDFTTLHASRDAGFRRLAAALSQHAIRFGDVRKSQGNLAQDAPAPGDPPW